MALPVPVSEAARLSETPVAFARVCLCGVETGIASAGEKWVFLVHYPGAEATPVSPVLCWGGEQWCCWFQRRYVVAPRLSPGAVRKLLTACLCGYCPGRLV